MYLIDEGDILGIATGEGDGVDTLNVAEDLIEEGGILGITGEGDEADTLIGAEDLIEEGDILGIASGEGDGADTLIGDSHKPHLALQVSDTPGTLHILLGNLLPISRQRYLFLLTPLITNLRSVCINKVESWHLLIAQDWHVTGQVLLIPIISQYKSLCDVSKS